MRRGIAGTKVPRPSGRDEVRDQVYGSYVSHKMRLIRAYDDDSLTRWSDNTYRQIRKWLPEDRDAVILDAGCGHGNLLHLLSSRGYRNIEGVDRSDEQVALARRVAGRVTCADLFHYLEAREAAYDLVLAFDLIEHFERSEVLAFLGAVFRALRPEGLIVLQTSNADSPWLVSERYADFTHEIAFNPHSLEHLLRLTGFVDYTASETGPVVHGVPSAIRWAVWRMIRGGLAVWNLAETGSAGSGIYTRVFRARARKP